MRPSPSEELEAEQDNSYPGIDLNAGWDRASLLGVQKHISRQLSLSDLRIISNLANFSLCAQQLLLPVPLDVTKSFTRFFKATSPVNKPFHTCRALVLSGHRSTLLLLKSPLTCFQKRQQWRRRHDAFDYYTTISLSCSRHYLFNLPPVTIARFCGYMCCLPPFRPGERERSFDNAITPATVTALAACEGAPLPPPKRLSPKWPPGATMRRAAP